ncbi:MAG: ABC transporter permease [Nakamurella sp.]
MGSYLLRRLASMVVVLFLISIIVFTLIHLAPGDPVAMRIPPSQYSSGTVAFIGAERHRLGLDRALPIQYFAWLGQIFHGDLGLSLISGESVGHLIGQRVGPTLELMSLALALAIVLALVFGTWAAVRKNRIVDYIVTFLSMLTISTPGFFVGILAIFVFSVKLRLLPSAGMSTTGVHTTKDALEHLVMPVLVLGLSMSAGLLRFVRGAMISELTSDYMRTALAKGLSYRAVVVKHVFRNALIPILTMIMLLVPALLSGAVLIEQIFAWPGMGSLIVYESSQNDYPVLIAFAMLTAVLVLLSNFVADILYTVVDPRVRLR